MASKAVARPLAAIGARAASTHLHNWDRLRVVASLDIIGSHLTGKHVLGGVGLPVFLLVSIALAVRKPLAGDRTEFLRKRLARVVLPWLVWSAVIACELTLRAESAWAWFEPRMLLYGPEIHLWFLPFSAVASAVAYQLHRRTGSEVPRRSAWIACVCACPSLAMGPLLELGWPFEQWGFSLPAVCMGFAVGRLLSTERERPAARLELLLVAATFLVVAALLHDLLPATAQYVVRHAGALVLITMLIFLPNPPDPITHHLAPLMLGVYILHLLVFRELIEPALLGFGFWLEPRQLIAADFIATCALVSLLRQTPLRHVL